MSRAGIETAIGFEGADIILRNHKGAESRYPVAAAVYNKSAIATPDMAVLLGNPQMSLYARETVTQQILPRLASAEQVPAMKMQRLLFRLKHPQGAFVLVLILGAAGVAAMYLLR
jgi:hypothetical protein